MTRTGWAAALTLVWSAPAMAAGPVGPAVTVKQIAPPAQLVKGVKTLRVNDFSGLNGAEIAAEIKAELANDERLKTDAAAMGKAALDAGTDVAASYVGGLVGGGIQGKIVEGLTKNTVSAVREATESDPLVLDSGLQINPFTLTEDKPDGNLGGTVEFTDSVEDYTTKQAATDGDGNVIKDADGNTVMTEVPCRRRSVEVSIGWHIRGGSNATGEVTRAGGDARCGADIGNLLDGQTIAAGITAGIGKEVVRDMAPAWRVRRLALNKTKLAKDALKLVRKSDWENARCAFGELAAAHPDDSDIQFDYGVFLEAFGHFNAAHKYYDAAIAIKAKKPYTKAKERASERKAEVSSMIRAYGLDWTVPSEPPPCSG